MNKKYFIVINDIITDKQLETFTKAITTNYVNIKAGEFMFLVVAPDTEKLKSIYDKISEKINDEISFVVIEFEFWYGKVYGDAFDWLEDKFPEKKLTRE